MSQYRQALFEIVTPVMGGLVIVLNIIEIGYILQQGKTQRPGAIYILNLAISDLVLGLTMVILKSIDPFMETDLKYDITAQEIYNIIQYCLLRLLMFVSVFNLLVLSVDRVWAISRPFSHRKKTASFAVKVCILVWILSIICVTSIFCMVRFYGGNFERYYNLVLPVATYLTTFAFAVCYLVIFREIRNSKIIRKESAPTFRLHKKGNAEGKMEWKFLKLAFKTVIVFVACWLPFSTCSLLIACGESCGGEDVKSSLFVLAFSNSIMNPFVYFTHTRTTITESMKNIYSGWTRKIKSTCSKIFANQDIQK